MASERDPPFIGNELSVVFKSVRLVFKSCCIITTDIFAHVGYCKEGSWVLFVFIMRVENFYVSNFCFLMFCLVPSRRFIKPID